LTNNSAPVQSLGTAPAPYDSLYGLFR
jgi:hypothetical protein